MKSAILALAIGMVIPQLSKASLTAHYYRAFQGFTRSDLSQERFLHELPSFMQDTVELYRNRALSNYLVILTPKGAPDFLPDEFALVALTDQQDYQAIRQTPEGQRYSARHWDVFEKATSKSADPMVDYSQTPPEKLVSNQSYNMLGAPLDWSLGVNTAFIGLRKSAFSSEAFLSELKIHIEEVARAFSDQGLIGYILIANDNYEVAYMNWENREAMSEAMNSTQGQKIIQHASHFMDTVLYQEAAEIEVGNPVALGAFYSTLAD